MTAGYGLCVYIYMVTFDCFDGFLPWTDAIPLTDHAEIIRKTCGYSAVSAAMHRNRMDIALRPLWLPYGGRAKIVRSLCDPRVFLENRVPKV